MSAAMGLSLVAGGTYAAFNDVEDTSAAFAAGTLEMDLEQVAEGKPFTFEVVNLKPGDTMTRDIKFVNKGSLAIKEVLMAIENMQFASIGTVLGDEPQAEMMFPGSGDSWFDNVNTDPLAFLDQFRVSIITLGAESGGDYQKELLGQDDNVTLKDFYLASDSLNSKDASSSQINAARSKVYDAINHKNYIKGHRLNVTTETNNGWEGLPVDPTDPDVLRLKIEFIDDQDKDEYGEYEQNIYQANGAMLTFSFEATQWEGQEITEDDLGENGYIETNEQANNGE